MIQIGGTKRIPIFLSQGTYGCVYRPGIQCGTNATLGKQFITKIHRKEKYAEKEINNSNKTKKMIKGKDLKCAANLLVYPLKAFLLEFQWLRFCIHCPAISIVPMILAFPRERNGGCPRT